jgi:LytS/YehU family sensor histidine kinase
VENALKHGVGQRLEGGTVRVKAWRERPAEFRLEVRSPGPLRTPEPDTPGSGLRNLRERIRLGFGETSSLVITEEPPEVVATLVIIHEHASGNPTPLPG